MTEPYAAMLVGSDDDQIDPASTSARLGEARVIVTDENGNQQAYTVDFAGDDKGVYINDGSNMPRNVGGSSLELTKLNLSPEQETAIIEAAMVMAYVSDDKDRHEDSRTLAILLQGAARDSGHIRS